MTTPLHHRVLAEHYRDEAITQGDLVDSFSEAISLGQLHAALYHADMLRAQVLATIGGRDAEVQQLLEPYSVERPTPRDEDEVGEGQEDFMPSFPPEVQTEAFDG